jgi:peptidoglycan/LPS O-acetylase OafA/YrhL
LTVKSEQDVLVHRHVPALDGVRGTAAATVFLYHYGGGAQSTVPAIRFLGTVIHFGWAGVSLFFVLSGFLISGILWDGYHRRNWWTRFYLRRSFRIFPLYYLAILIAAVVWFIQGFPWSQIAPLGYYVLYLGDVPALARFFNRIPSTVPIGHFWSLAVEEQFYIFWPFLLALVAGKRNQAKTLILSLWALSLVFRVAILAFHAPPDWASEFLLGRAGELLAGAYLALAVRGGGSEQTRLFRILPYTLGAGVVAIVAVCVFAGGPGFDSPLMSTIGLSILSLLFASVVGCSLQPGAVQAVFSFPFLRWLGKISYGIYVYHLLLRSGFQWITDQLIHTVAPGMGPNPRLILLFFVALAGTLAAASLSFYTYETAFLRLKDRFAR